MELEYFSGRTADKVVEFIDITGKHQFEPIQRQTDSFERMFQLNQGVILRVKVEPTLDFSRKILLELQVPNELLELDSEGYVKEPTLSRTGGETLVQEVETVFSLTDVYTESDSLQFSSMNTHDGQHTTRFIENRFNANPEEGDWASVYRLSVAEYQNVLIAVSSSEDDTDGATAAIRRFKELEKTKDSPHFTGETYAVEEASKSTIVNATEVQSRDGRGTYQPTVKVEGTTKYVGQGDVEVGDVFEVDGRELLISEPLTDEALLGNKYIVTDAETEELMFAGPISWLFKTANSIRFVEARSTD